MTAPVAAPEAITIRKTGYVVFGSFWLVVGGLAGLVLTWVSFQDLPGSLFVLISAACMFGLAAYGWGFARNRIRADAQGIEVRGRTTERFAWGDVAEIVVPRPKDSSKYAEYNASMARLRLTGGRLVNLLPASSWLRPSFWSGLPAAVSEPVARLEALRSAAS